MQSAVRLVIAVVLSGVLVVNVVAAPREGGARILRVERLEVAGSAGGAGTSLLTSRLPKFTGRPARPDKEVFHVYWTPSPEGLAAGTLVTFEYRQERDDRVRFLSIKYPFTVEGQRKAVFEIAGAALRVGGRVSAWRVRVVRGGRVLAQRSSGSWK